MYVFTGEKVSHGVHTLLPLLTRLGGRCQDEYKSMALDEFPQMEKPFLGDRIKMEKKWVAEGKKTLLQMQREADPSVGDGPGPALRSSGPGHVLTATKHTASRDEL